MSIRIKSATRGRRIGAKIGSTKPYAGVIEFGHRSSVREYRRKGVKVSGYTRQLQNKPYLMPTLDANRTAIIAKVQAIINRGLQTVWEGGFGG